VFVLVLVASVFAPQTTRQVSSRALFNNVLTRALDIELGRVRRAKYQQALSSGALYTVLQASGELDRRADVVREPSPPVFSHRGPQGSPDVSLAAPLGVPNNTRVNQDWSLRRQAEGVIAVNPTNPKNLIAGANDSRIGFNHCAYAFSFDGGLSWEDLVPPFYGFILADNHTADACSDPTVTFDVVGNAYIAGVLFDVNSPASALVVAKSNADIGGMFYHSPDKAQFFQTFKTDPLGVVASDNNEDIFHDKEFIVADAHPGSPKRNRVYVTWTRFNNDTGAGVGGNSPIYFSQSTNGGATWSPGIEISGANATFCTAFSGSANPNACDQDQGSHPIVGPGGTIYVAFANGNTPLLGIDQLLIVKCPATKDCRVAANWTAPVRISNLITKQPDGPDPVTGCPNGRKCLPPNGYRVTSFVWNSLSVDGLGKLYSVFSDFRNGSANCQPNGQAAQATPPCDNDVFYSFSVNRGATWSAPRNVTPKAVFGPNAQWQPWSAVTSDGGILWVAYYDRSYGNCEFDGCNDITLAKVLNPALAAPTIRYTRLTTSSMPNLVPANNPVQAGFLGDYMWVTVDKVGNPYVVWADTRGLYATVEEDVYFATVKR
jgi:hypothetical protein